MSLPPSPPPSLPPHAEISKQLTLAREGWMKLKRMLSYAAFDGWTLTILGGLTLICGGYGSALDLCISFVLLGTGLFEIHCVRQLRRLNSSAISHMAYNQLALAGGLILYSIIKLSQNHSGTESSEMTDILAMIGSTTDDVRSGFSTAMYIVYTGLIVFTFLIQGGTAFYYFSRQKYLQQYLEQTPEWIHQMQRERGVISL